MNGKTTVTVNGISESADVGKTVASVLKIDMPCNGHGICGKCKVKVTGNVSEPTGIERELLTNIEIDSGIRLACNTVIEGECEIKTLDVQSNAIVLTDGCYSDFLVSPTFKKYGIAIDIGTTTIAASLYDVKGETISRYSLINPQVTYGADVISRIEASLKGEKEALSSIIIEAINNLIYCLAEDGGISTFDIDGVVITGNTVMLYFLTSTDVEPFSHAPFDAPELFGKDYNATALRLSALKSDTSVFIPNCISAFIGADIVCALIASGMHKTKQTELLVDIGTNGEIVLVHNGTFTVSSTAAGPAFEAVGISMGMRGEDGAVDRVLVQNGKIVTHTIGEIIPKGICGSGIVDAIAALLDLGIIDETGYLEEEFTVISSPVTLTGKDIRKVQLAKSAISAGINTLIMQSEIKNDDILVLNLAGGFGSYLNIESAARIGLIPKDFIKKVRVCGNAALSGAAMLLLNADLRDCSETVVKKSKVLELSGNSVFAEEYVRNIIF